MATMKAAARSSMARAGLAAGEGAAGGDKAPGAAGGAERGAARPGAARTAGVEPVPACAAAPRGHRGGGGGRGGGRRRTRPPLRALIGWWAGRARPRERGLASERREGAGGLAERRDGARRLEPQAVCRVTVGGKGRRRRESSSGEDGVRDGAPYGPRLGRVRRGVR